MASDPLKRICMCEPVEFLVQAAAHSHTDRHTHKISLHEYQGKKMDRIKVSHTISFPTKTVIRSKDFLLQEKKKGKKPLRRYGGF